MKYRVEVAGAAKRQLKSCRKKIQVEFWTNLKTLPKTRVRTVTNNYKAKKLFFECASEIIESSMKFTTAFCWY